MEFDERYYSYFNLEYNPFVKNNIDNYVHKTKDIEELYYKLDYLFKTKGIGLITGKPGYGKTTAIRNYCKNLNKALYKVIYISMTTLTESELYKFIIKEFGYEVAYKKSDNYRIIQNIINDYENKKITPVIIIDEANYLSRGMLNDIKMIFNFKMDSYDNYILLLTGLPSITGTLANMSNEPLRQRIIMNYEFKDMEETELRDYIYSKIEKAGGSSSILDSNVIHTLMNITKGVLRTVDRIMDYSLLIAYTKKSNVITNEIIENATSQIV